MTTENSRCDCSQCQVRQRLDAEGAMQIQLDQLQATVQQLIAERDELQAKCVALGRYVSIGRRQKSQYFRAVKWFLANTNVDPKIVPKPVYHTLVHVVTTLAEKAKRAAAEVV
ncbi:hypothetical protein KKQ11_00370 [Pseudomonas sp. MG-2]|uniref:hypothetical protein n=1 Tax=Pseudomonas sp. MG-2 TaxID=405714 RepID=UPI001C00737B|nr:hypothetical protein [Pseudomonas sp. MG-2]MBT9234276.1 hypothetical protein [Pseudomonas sp. MG-2]